MPGTMLFTRRDVAALLPLGECITAVADAFYQLGVGKTAPPATLSVPSTGGSFHVKAGILQRGDRRYFAAKSNGNFPGNAIRGELPTIQGVLVLCDADDGRVLAVMDSTEITALRTAAATGVAARHLARADAAVAALCGCGVQGRVQLRALAEVLPLRRVHVYDVRPGQARAFADDMAALLHLPVEVEADVADAVAHADVCVTCTTATEFIVGEEMVRAGTFIAGVGVDSERKRELTPGLLASTKVVTDLRDQCAKIGDLRHAIQAHTMALTDVYADLADIVAGNRAGRENDEEIIVFDSTGLALQDVAAAAAVYERAAAMTASGDGSTVSSIELL